MNANATLPSRLLLAAVLALPLPLAAQQPDPLPGYTAEGAARQRALEADAVARVSADSAVAWSRELAAATHVAGTEAQARTRDWVVERMRSWGLRAEPVEYTVWMPHATSVAVHRVSPEPAALSLPEPPIPGDPYSRLPQYPTVNGYSAAGDTTAELVYVNYGLPEDYERLDSLDVSVEGKVAIARYGRSFRGIKAREAEERGAVALLIYSDPADDGEERGPTFPEGPWRPPHSVQRGSVFNGVGDPTTPGRPSTGRVRRVEGDERGLPEIPVVPLSADNAAELLRFAEGAEPPETWRGGLDGVSYRVGPGPVRVRVRVTTDAETHGFKPIWNTIAILRGSDLPDEWVLVGAHRDAWGPGSVDNVSGTVSVMEMARVLTRLAAEGRRPRRTLVFATWDAEEWGLIGSTEYVEHEEENLLRSAVAYLNQDVAAAGPNFGAGGSPSLREVLRGAARAVPDPSGEGSVYDAWRRRTGVADTLEPPVGDPGGGSDFAGFYNHLGIPHADWGFGGPYGVYHSHYDDPVWMERFGDPDGSRRAAAAAVGAAMLLRLANAEVLPYDYVEYARTMRGYLPALDSALAEAGWEDLDATPLLGAIARFERSASAFAVARDRALARGGLPRDRREETNRMLMRVERAFARRTGLEGRPWYRTLIYASDRDNGYATVVFPAVREAIADDDRARADAEITELAARFSVAANALRRAEEAVSDRR